MAGFAALLEDACEGSQALVIRSINMSDCYLPGADPLWCLPGAKTHRSPGVMGSSLSAASCASSGS